MFQSLRSRYANLERANEDLERQVRERTHELEQLKDEAERQARTDPLALIITPPIPSFRQDAGIQCHGWQASGLAQGSTSWHWGPGSLPGGRLDGIMTKADPLTGLANRGALHDVADRLLKLAMRSQRPLSLIMLDIDHFKRINDTRGHTTPAMWH